MSKIELKTLFSPEKIGSVEIKNRIIRSATFTNTASKMGTPGEKTIEFYKELARGGTGLIITGITSIDQVGRNAPGIGYPGDPGCYCCPEVLGAK